MNGEVICRRPSLRYLRRIELIELGKPQKQRRATPTITELAEAVGGSRATMSEVINGNRKMLNLKTLGEIVSD